MPRPRIFISYSHQPTAHAGRVHKFIDGLASSPVEVRHDGEIDLPQGPAEGWIGWMRDQVEKADWVLVVCNEPYLDSWMKRPDSGKGGAYEAALLVQELYRERMVNRKLVPVVFSEADGEFIPPELRDATRYSLPTQWDLLMGRLLKSTWLGRFIGGLGEERGGDGSEPSPGASAVLEGAERLDVIAEELPAVATLRDALISESNNFVTALAAEKSSVGRVRLAQEFRSSFCSRSKTLIEISGELPPVIEQLFERYCEC